MVYLKNIFFFFLFLNFNSIYSQAVCEKFESLKKAFKEENLGLVCELDLRNQNLKELPANIGSLTKLEILRLENNKLSSLPESIVNAQKLVRIHLDDNLFTTFPEPLLKLEHLEKLSMNNNGLKELPQPCH